MSNVSSLAATWVTLILLLTGHLLANWAAVRSCCLKSLNRQRTNILFSHLVEYQTVLSPAEVAAKEYIFERDGALRWNQGIKLGYCQIGVGLQDLLSSMAQPHQRTSSSRVLRQDLVQFLDLFQRRKYLLWYRPSNSTVMIALKEQVTVMDQITAWVHALLLGRELATGVGRAIKGSSYTRILKQVDVTGRMTDDLVRESSGRLREAGWDLQVAALETKPGKRVSLGRAL